MFILLELISEPFRKKRHENLMKLLKAEMQKIKEESTETTLHICPHANDRITELVIEGDYTVKMHYRVPRDTSKSLKDQKSELNSQYKGFYYLKSDGKKLDFLADISNELKENIPMTFCSHT